MKEQRGKGGKNRKEGVYGGIEGRKRKYARRKKKECKNRERSWKGKGMDGEEREGSV